MLGRNNSNVTNYFYTEEGKKSFIDYFKSLPIEWGNIDAPYMQNMVIPATKTTKKRQPKAVTPTTDVFEWTTGLLDWGTQNMQKEFKQGYEITEKDFSIVYREFSITKNGQKREYRVLRFYPKIANKSNKYQKFSRDVYAEEVNVYKTDDLPNQHADLQSFVLHPNYDFSVIVPVDKVNEFNTKFMFPVLPVTTTTTEPFEWTGDWSDYSVNFPSLIDYFKSVLGITVNDFTIKNRPFTINTPTGKKEYFIFGYYPSNMPPNKEYEAYLQEVQDEETKYKTAPLYSLYKPLTEIAQGGEYDYTVIVPYDNVVDFMAKFVTGYKQSSTPPAPTSNFKWVDTPWNNFLRESYLKSFIEYYGGSADGQIVTASFRAGYPTVTDPQKEFFIVGFANAGAGKEYKELKLKLAKYANKIDVLALHDNYGNEFTDAVNNYQFEFDDLWFFDADDYLDIVDLLLYRGAGTTPPTTPPTPPTPPAPEPPKTKTTKPKTTITKEPKQPKPTKAASIKNKLDELDLDDI
jgi:hypothetical protein